MYWQENDTEISFEVPDDIVDVRFSIACRRLPVDHAYALSAALQQVVPWIGEHNSRVGVHTVHVAGSQNGWERPEHGTGRHLILSKRTKLTLRAPKERMDELIANLEGKILDVSGCPLTIGSVTIRPLSKETTLFSRYVVRPAAGAVRPYRSGDSNLGCGPPTAMTGVPNTGSQGDDTEEGFLDWAVQELRDRGIRVRKALCGKTTPLTTPSGMLRTRSLMLADLSPEESVGLQQGGLGPHRVMGCGIFIPHKGIDAVGKMT